MPTLTIWPIIVSTVVTFIVSSIWFSPLLFGKEWMALCGYTEADIAAMKPANMLRKYIAQLVTIIVISSILAFFIISTGAATASEGAFMGLLAWLGFVATTLISGVIWERKPLKHFFISAIGNLICFVIGGAIIGGWM